MFGDDSEGSPQEGLESKSSCVKYYYRGPVSQRTDIISGIDRGVRGVEREQCPGLERELDEIVNIKTRQRL